MRKPIYKHRSTGRVKEIKHYSISCYNHYFALSNAPHQEKKRFMVYANSEGWGGVGWGGEGRGGEGRGGEGRGGVGWGGVG